MEGTEASSSAGGHAPNGSIISETEFFIFHKVNKLDTLAGIAIKYNVQVGDVKLANGLHSDMSLYARDHIKIPKKKLPPSMYYKPESKHSAGGGHHGGAGPPSLNGGGGMSVAMTQLKNYYGLERVSLEDRGEAGATALAAARAHGKVVNGSNGVGGAGGAAGALSPPSSGKAAKGAASKPSLSGSGIIEAIMKKEEEERAQPREDVRMMPGSSGAGANLKLATGEKQGANGAMISSEGLIRKRGGGGGGGVVALGPLQTNGDSGNGGAEGKGMANDPAAFSGSRMAAMEAAAAKHVVATKAGLANPGSAPSSPKGKKGAGGGSPSLAIRPPLFDKSKSAGKPKDSGGVGAMASAGQPSQKKESIFQKIKKAANKPALAGPAMSKSRSMKLLDLGEVAISGSGGSFTGPGHRTAKSDAPSSASLFGASKLKKAD
mmetsp:Transcript_437/g.806  ORF Transcript_437/g.806 Transcript_437/m.806 type:complete len:434 (+) Transcript_437:198-1499(+)